MNTSSLNTLYYGDPQPLPEEIHLKAGPLSLIYANGWIRHIRVGQHIIVQQIYAAVRDQSWDTIVPQFEDVSFDIQDDSFEVTFLARHIRKEIDFSWHGIITGTADGKVIFKFDGQANSAFQRNRIGFCVLHPASSAGQAALIEHVDGSTTQANFPQLIQAQQPFFNIRAITTHPSESIQARVLMEGDIFEMEDQRNWTDASFKTYCTPSALPKPIIVEAGTRVWQRISITASTSSAVEDQSRDAAIQFQATDKKSALPEIGLASASHGQPLSDREAALLSKLNLGHLRINLYLQTDNFREKLQAAIHQSQQLQGVPLEIALFLSENGDQELRDLRLVADDLQPSVIRWIILHESELSAPPKWVRLAHQHLEGYADVPIGSGTDGYFTELNTNHPTIDEADFLSYSLNPQVHAFDNMTMVENLPIQGITIKTAQSFAPQKHLIVGPITLKKRYEPAAAKSESAPSTDELPAQVDNRQISLFGAGWTLGSIKYLAEAGAQSLTYYETTGWLGVIEQDQGNPLPDKFPSQPGMVYPIYLLLETFANYHQGTQVIGSISSSPLKVDGLIIDDSGAIRIYLVNFTDQPQTVTVQSFAGNYQLQRLDENTTGLLKAMEKPTWTNASMVKLETNGTAIELKPFSVALLKSVAE